MARRYNSDLPFSGPAFSFRNFRREYDDSDNDDDDKNEPAAALSFRNFRREYDDSDNDDNNGPAAAAAFSAACPTDSDNLPLSPRENLDDDSDGPRRDVDSDEEPYSQGRKRRFHSSSSSSQSPYRSCKSSLSPQNSAYLTRLASEDSDENVDDKGRSTASREYSEGYHAVSRKAKACTSSSNFKSFCFTDEDESDEEYEEGWKELPAILLEDIFVLLTPKQRHQASMVCRPWYEIFYSPRVWETFVLIEGSLTWRRFNLYKGYQRELCPRKTQLCLMRVGCFFKRIVVTPISDYYNLYEFLRVLAAFLAYFNDFPMPMLHTFRFTFACESRGMNGVVIIGTGGNILDKVKELMNNMQQLRHLAVNQLLLDVEEVPGLLAAAANHCTDTLQSLEILNCSKVPVPLCEVAQFNQLIKLKLSAQHLSEEMIIMLGGTQLLQLHIVQDAYTCSCQPVASEAWKMFKEMAPHKRVFLEIEGLTKTPLMLQPHAPVRGVIFRTPYHRLQPELTTWLVEYYGKYLEYFVQERLPRAHGSRKFSQRADESLLRLVRECPRLHTLVVRERISLATLLLIAREGKRLRSFIVRKNALIKKCEWPRAKNWTEDFYHWLRRHGRNYDLAFQEMPRILGQRWKPTVDRSFKHTRLLIT